VGGGTRSRSIVEVQRSNSGSEERLRSGGGRSEGLPHKRKSLDLRETNAQEGTQERSEDGPRRLAMSVRC
jgi:hypothetical protein